MHWELSRFGALEIPDVDNRHSSFRQHRCLFVFSWKVVIIRLKGASCVQVLTQMVWRHNSRLFPKRLQRLSKSTVHTESYLLFIMYRWLFVVLIFPHVLAHQGRSCFQDGHYCSKTSNLEDEWVVEINGGLFSAQQLTQSMGYKIIGEVILHSFSHHLKALPSIQQSLSLQVLGFKDMYRVKRSNLWRFVRNSDLHLADDVRVSSPYLQIL